MRGLGTAGLLAFVVTLAPSAGALVWPDVPERIERGLSSPDPGTRRSAAHDLATLGAARATPLVMKALTDADVDVRLAAADAAIRLRVEAATDAVVLWLGEREPRLRIAACDVALAMPNARAVQPLARALGDVDAPVRSACADALGASGSSEAVAPLSGKLDDSTPNVRARVARALARLGDARAVVPLVGKVQDSVPEVRQAVVRALGDLGDTRASQALLLALRDNVPEVRIEALAAVGRLRAPDAVDPIAPLVLDRNPAVRKAALAALGRIGTPAAVGALVSALGTFEDATMDARRTPVRDALVDAGAPAVAELTTLLGRPTSPTVAASAALVLGVLRATKSAPAIVSALRRGTLPSAAGLAALAGAGTAEQVPVVLEFVADADPMTRASALVAATALLDPARPDGRAVEPLAAALKDARLAPAERAELATLLGRTGAARAATPLIGLVRASDEALRLAAIDALGELGGASTPATAPDARKVQDAADEALLPLLADDDPAVRLRASVALATGGGTAARRALVAKLDGGTELDRFALFGALGGVLARHPDEAAARRVFAELPIAAGPERDAVIQAAGRVRAPSIVAALASAAKADDVDDRRAVATVLAAQAGSADAVTLTRALMRDPDASVRAEATFALGSIASASAVPALAALVQGQDADVATNAAGAIARIAWRSAPDPSAIASAVCPMLRDRRAPVRANALSALVATRRRCGDGDVERRLLADDASALVRAAAAAALTTFRAAPGGEPTAEDRPALERCAATDRSAEVASICRPHPWATSAPGPRRARPVTVFVVGATTPSTPRPRAPFLLQDGDGVLRAGVADRRGATFDPTAPEGDLVLRLP